MAVLRMKVTLGVKICKCVEVLFNMITVHRDPHAFRPLSFMLSKIMTGETIPIQHKTETLFYGQFGIYI